ncbi:hypothetical protein A3K80_05345 [Candidatus Bathyarchaeota archaeon RBG_13_38_9]|nr:MAG: hypothetical protein A3K80_05345 [Candidatus Bathyarchaeota archaeon RBG_13_38_9]
MTFDILQPTEKSLFHYGRRYQILIDPLLKEERNNIIDMVPEGSIVLDAGCGTGKLCFLLKQRKNCKVVGIDSSLKMIVFAQRKNPYDDVVFLHRNVGNISDYKDNYFDFTVMCMVIHELPLDKQVEAMYELMRLGRKNIIVDNNFPLPKNIRGLIGRMIEATYGRDHKDNFKSFLAAGGIVGILEKIGFQSKITYRLVFNDDCRLLIELVS